MFKSLLSVGFSAFALTIASPALAQDAAPPIRMPLTHKVPAEIAADPANHLTLELSNGGKVVIQLRPDAAPNHVYRIQTLASRGFYNGTIFHRVIPGFMAQGGDPEGTGQGGSDLPDLEAEFSRLPHLRGVFAMARAQEENSANSQFYIMLSPQFALDEEYTVLGRVISGMDAVDNIAKGEPPRNPTSVVRAYINGPLPAGPMVTAAPAAPADAAPEAEAPAE